MKKKTNLYDWLTDCFIFCSLDDALNMHMMSIIHDNVPFDNDEEDVARLDGDTDDGDDDDDDFNLLISLMNFKNIILK